MTRAMDLPPGGAAHGSPAKCGGTNRAGQPCGNRAGKSTDHVGSGNCANHGGASPSGRIAAARARALAELAALDVEPVGDPLNQLTLLAGQAVAWKNAMAGRVNHLASLRYEGPGAGEQLRAEVALWERALDRCERVLTAMIRLNIDERLAKISEQQSCVLEQCLRGAIADLGLGLESQERAAQALGRRLKLVAQPSGTASGRSGG